MMFRKPTLAAAVILLAGANTWAADQKVEISGTAGWTFSDGVSGDSRTIPGIGTFDRIDPKSSFAWGARIGFMATPNWEIGGLFSQQQSKLQVGGTTTYDVGDMTVRNLHGYFAYNFGEPDAGARPYLLLGLGASQFGDVTAQVGTVQRNLAAVTKFSPTVAAGLKVFPGRNAGIRLEARWTPTYIKSDAAGWWCDPYWGCYVVGNAQYANQFEVGGGIVLRF